MKKNEAILQTVNEMITYGSLYQNAASTLSELINAAMPVGIELSLQEAINIGQLFTSLNFGVDSDTVKQNVIEGISNLLISKGVDIDNL